MILPFSTIINKKPSYFVEKIWSGFDSILSENTQRKWLDFEIGIFEKASLYQFDYSTKPKPKLHTIREDVKNRWKVGTKIHFYINSRQKNMFQFAPVLKVKAIQDVFMTYAHNDLIQISIDGKELFGYEERLQFAINDGFDNWEDFFNYFYPVITNSHKQQFKGKIIHWTNKTY